MHDQVVVGNDLMADALFEHFNGLLGSPAQRSRTARLDTLALPTNDLSALDVCFTEEEIWTVIRDVPAEKSPGPRWVHRPLLQKKKKPRPSSRPMSLLPLTPFGPWTAEAFILSMTP